MDHNDISRNLYIHDVLHQPDALRSTLRRLDLSCLTAVSQAFQRGEFDRMVLTGMGASLYSAYPAWLHLCAAGHPAIWMETAELLHYATGLIGRRTLLWIVSQSGQSAEALGLLNQVHKSSPAALLVTVNDLESPLATSLFKESKPTPLFGLLPLNVEPEQTPSTRSYLASLALNQLAALYLSGQEIDPHLHDLEKTIDGISEYLVDWKEHMAALGDAIGDVPHIAFLGRGASLASAHTGALMLQEVGKFPAFSMSAASFRHGPLECVASNLAVLIFAGAEHTRSLNIRLYETLQGLGARAIWLDSLPTIVRGDQPEAKLSLPGAFGIGLPLAEMIPIQLLAAHLAVKAGFVPGEFLHSGKVTTQE